jgi:hypothetical protein
MKRILKYNCFIIFALLFLLFPAGSVSQTDGLSTLTKSDSLKSGSSGTNHSLITGAGYGSNLIYLGSTISQNQPYGYVSLTYGLKNKLFASVSAIHLKNLNPFLAFYTGSVNYSHAFNSWFDISAGIYRYQVVPSLTDTLFSSFTYADIAFGIDWKLIYTRLSGGGVFSDDNMAYFQIKNSRYFQIPSLFKGKADISFDPYLNLLFGTIIEAETSPGKTITITAPFRRWRLEGIGTTITTSTRKFGIMEIDFGLPVAFNTDRFTIEAEASYIIPVYQDQDYPGTRGFIFLLSGYFRFF